MLLPDLLLLPQLLAMKIKGNEPLVNYSHFCMCCDIRKILGQLLNKRPWRRMQ
jgi:hypothetical protein